MRVAIIEDNLNYQEVLKSKMYEYNDSHDKVIIDFFIDSKEFGFADLEQYKIIISSVHLPLLIGPEILNSIKFKTKAHLALMSSRTDWISDEIIKDPKIETILDKKNPEKIIEWIGFIQSRTLINTFNEQIRTTYNEFTIELNHIKT